MTLILNPITNLSSKDKDEEYPFRASKMDLFFRRIRLAILLR
jgi:hypothetical protein